MVLIRSEALEAACTITCSYKYRQPETHDMWTRHDVPVIALIALTLLMMIVLNSAEFRLRYGRCMHHADLS
jgi:hypothetical protein